MTEFLVWCFFLLGSYILILTLQLIAKAGERLFNAMRRKWKGTF